MGGPGDPPAGTPEGAPSGGEDEYRSVVFDESFVRAARLQEFSAQERMGDHARAVRRRPALHRGLSRQVVLLVVLIALAFGTAIFMGIRHPYQSPTAKRPEPLRMTVVPLAPQGRVPGSTRVADLYARSPAAQFRMGAGGINLPGARRTAHFSDSQVTAALTAAKDYLVESSLNPDTLTGGSPRSVRLLLDPDQHTQFDRSFAHPAADGRHAPTGWLVRFDPTETALADKRVRTQGTLRLVETDKNTLEVTSDHTFVYALRPAAEDGAGAGGEAGSRSGAESGDEAKASLFTVRRELHFRFDRDDLRMHRAELISSTTQAGPLTCAAKSANHLRPLLAGQRAKAGGPAGTDPYATGKVTALCGSLAASAQPSLSPS
ncbi:SCO2583 family membrane protein [Streptomyces sp. NPDC003006]